ncbi:hypothetical protein ACRN9V_15790 [Shewanella baltica]|jgi:hypothetical protein|uniref:hypothetical protein n=1 Tax=Shewanella baltica TaxID=62322 RepID=UPI003D78DA8B
MDQNTIIGLISGALLAYVIPKLSPYIDKFLKQAFGFLLNTVLKPLKGYFRKKQLVRLKEFRIARVNHSAVTMQVVRAHTYFLLFWGVIAFYLNLLTEPAFPAILEKSFVFGMLLTSPIYVFELLWLSADHKAKKLVKSRGQLGLR